MVTTVAALLVTPASTDRHMTLVFDDEFSGSSVGSQWTIYQGIGGPGTNNTQWAKSHVLETGGYLNIYTYKDSAYGGKWVTGGLSLAKFLNFTYGTVEVRYRIDKAKGIKYAILLWPQTGWPPEIDFAEGPATSDTAVRHIETATLHYAPNNTMIHNQHTGDFTQWHTASVQWKPGQIIYSADGVPWATVNSTHVPTQPMHLAMQGGVVNPDSTTPPRSVFQIDYVRIYQ